MAYFNASQNAMFENIIADIKDFIKVKSRDDMVELFRGIRAFMKIQHMNTITVYSNILEILDDCVKLNTLRYGFNMQKLWDGPFAVAQFPHNIPLSPKQIYMANDTFESILIPLVCEGVTDADFNSALQNEILKEHADAMSSVYNMDRKGKTPL